MMDTHALQLGDGKTADVQLRIISSDGLEYDANPVYLHSHVLKKSKYFEARLSDRWSADMSSFPEIRLTLPPDGSAENYIKCIGLLYSSYSGRDLSFSDVDETLHILPVASELLFEEGIQACMQYLEALCWNPQQKLKIRALLSSLQVNVSADLAERLKMPESSFREEVEVLKKRLPEMLSETIDGIGSFTCAVPVDHKRFTMERYTVAYFEEDVPPAIQNICRDTLLNKCKLKIEGIKYENSIHLRAAASKGLLWLLDLIKLCERELFESAFKMFVEDAGLVSILVNLQIKGPPVTLQIWSGQTTDRSETEADTSHTTHLLDVLVDRFLKALANGEIITPKSIRISFLTLWVPVMAHLICRSVSLFGRELRGSSLEYSKRFEEGVTKVIRSVPVDDQKRIFNHYLDVSRNFPNHERETFQWWINAIWLAVMKANSSHFQIE